MGLRTGIALVGVAVLALAAWAWLATGPSGAPVSAPAPAQTAPGRATELRAPAGPSEERGSVAQPAPVESQEPAVGLSVLSSSGLALAGFDWRAPGGDWRRVELDDGVAREVPPAPCEVRAAGHVVATLQPDQTELTLEPDVLFVLRAPDLRDCVRSIYVPYGVQRAMRRSLEEVPPSRGASEVGLWGYVSDSEWAITLSADVVRRELGESEVSLGLLWRDGRNADAHLHVTSGARGTWDVPCGDSFPVAPLAVTVERLAGAPSSPIVVQVGRHDVSHQDGRQEDHAWGRVVHHPVGRTAMGRTLDGDVDALEFEAFPLDVPLTVAAQDTESKAYGRVAFVHDGTPRTVTLREPLRTVGRLLDARDDAPLERASLTWECRVDGASVQGWRAEAPAAELAADGSFALAGPKSPPISPSTPIDPVGTLWVRIESPGFEALHLERELGAERLVDLGDLRLVARAPELVLAPGHGLTPDLVAWHKFEIAGQSGRAWEVRWGLLTDDGALELHFGGEAPGGLQALAFLNLSGRPFPGPDWEDARALILYTNDHEVPVRAFERDPQGRYAAVELRRHALEFQVEPSASERYWLIGWEWNGLFGKCEGFTRPAAGETLRVELSAPVDGARLAWASREPGGRERLVPDELAPLVDPMPVLVLR